MPQASTLPSLSPSSRTHRLDGVAAAGDGWRPTLLLREQIPTGGDRSRPVLYVHGATFPSDASIMFRFEGASWADSLNAAGFDVFGLDFAGYGGSERYPAMQAAPTLEAPLGRASVAADQIERAVRQILAETGAPHVSLIAHSWGTMAAGRFAGLHPKLVDRLVLFGPLTPRDGPASPAPIPAWREITVAEQQARFIAEVPAGAAPVIVEADFPRWARTYLAADPTSAARAPPSVRTPNGPAADVAEAWSGRLPYDPARIRAPTLIVRGEWDTLCTDTDAAGLRAELTGALEVCDLKIPRATHLMHLEAGRKPLYAATRTFLKGGRPGSLTSPPSPG